MVFVPQSTTNDLSSGSFVIPTDSNLVLNQIQRNFSGSENRVARSAQTSALRSSEDEGKMRRTNVTKNQATMPLKKNLNKASGRFEEFQNKMSNQEATQQASHKKTNSKSNMDLECDALQEVHEQEAEDSRNY
jgi:vesicle coat complex subunit